MTSEGRASAWSYEERARHRVGTTLRGKWRLDTLLGVGGMGAVFAATHRNGTRAAVKLLHTEFCMNEPRAPRSQAGQPLRHARASGLPSTTNTTRVGSILGTPAFLSPTGAWTLGRGGRSQRRLVARGNSLSPVQRFVRSRRAYAQRRARERDDQVARVTPRSCAIGSGRPLRRRGLGARVREEGPLDRRHGDAGGRAQSIFRTALGTDHHSHAADRAGVGSAGACLAIVFCARGVAPVRD